jgi:hypothetical protein
MSLVKIQGNASGTGEFTIAAPNSNTNRTLTLPDATGTILTTQAAGGVSTNTALGTNALSANTTGSNTTAVGYQALDANTTGANNTAVGSDALGANNTGSNNTAVGYGALDANTSGAHNTAVGYNALGNNTTGISNTAFGGLYTGNYDAALASNTTGNGNSAFGVGALATNGTASNSTAVGYQALYSSTGGLNTALGYRAGDGITTGDKNVCIGYDVDTSGATGSDQIVIGSQMTGQQNSSVTIGSGGGKIYNLYTVNATWTQTSDERLKKNIQDDTLGLSFVNRLRPVKYEWKASNELDQDNPYYAEENKRTTGVTMHGMLAQEVKSALDAEGVTTFAGWDVGSDGLQAISREMFVTPLIKAIQELSAKVDAQAAEIAALKGQA